jgi:intracellular multiplication protein IcmJ
MLKLILSIKRLTFRDNDPKASRADAEAKAKRPAALARGRYTCQACGYVTNKADPKMDIHHLDDDHHNNRDDNLVCACHVCHPYQHVGQTGQGSNGDKIEAENLGKATFLVSVPEVNAANFNLLQRAIGAALLDPKEAPYAQEIMKILANRVKPVEAEFGTYEPVDFAAAMARLSNDEYERREEVMWDLRLLFGASSLKKFGQQLLNDHPALAVRQWEALERSVMSRKVIDPQT